MKPAFTKHKNNNNGNYASIPRWMVKWYRYNGGLWKCRNVDLYFTLNLQFKYAFDIKIPIHVRNLAGWGLHSNMNLNSILLTV